MTVSFDGLTIERPGVYDIPNDIYQLDPVPGGSLSSSGARKLLPPSCPALYRYWADHPRPPKREFDIGHAAHRLVLGVGEELVVVDAPDWRTKAAKTERDEAYDDGKVPLLRAEYDTVTAMAEALRAHPFAAALFNPERGAAEQTIVWDDTDSGVRCRARLDWLPDPGAGRLIVPDYKTANSAEPGHIQKSVFNYGYHVQHWWYTDGIRAAGVDDAPAFVFVVQEKTPPYLVTVVQLDDEAVALGEQASRRAREVYAECVATGEWPAYSSDVAIIQPPRWLPRTEEDL